jgi:hypothetical protein
LEFRIKKIRNSKKNEDLVARRALVVDAADFGLYKLVSGEINGLDSIYKGFKRLYLMVFCIAILFAHFLTLIKLDTISSEFCQTQYLVALAVRIEPMIFRKSASGCGLCP